MAIFYFITGVITMGSVSSFDITNLIMRVEACERAFRDLSNRILEIERLHAGIAMMGWPEFVTPEELNSFEGEGG